MFLFLLISKIVGAFFNKDIFLIASGHMLADHKVKKIFQTKIQ